MDQAKRKLSIVGITSLFFLVVFTACTSRAERTLTAMELLLDSLEAQFAPDGRVELWSLSTNIEDRMLILEGEMASKAAYDAVTLAVNEEFPEVTTRVRLLPEHDQDRLVNALVNNSVAHLRRNPSSKSELVSQVLLGTPVRILKEEEGMFFIQVPDGYMGWVNMNEVHFMEAEELSAYRDMEKLVYASQYGFAYSGPDENSLPVADLVLACTLPVIAQKGAFYQVLYPDGRLAWVKEKEVLPAADVFNKVATREEVILAAMDFHGLPYLWGGASAKNLDCSGFVSNVFFMNGIQMPRDADQQSFCGRVITTRYDASELEIGDLLFFGRKATPEEAERVSHVAIYKGESEFIHAAGFRDRVSINSMDSTQANFIDTYPEIFVRACRIIGEEPKGFLPIVRNNYYKELIK
jgi:uncharacterized protein YgiM (DUF1202 family)